MALVSPQYHFFSKNGSRSKKSVIKVDFGPWKSLCFFSVFEKMLDFDSVWYPNHLTHIKTKGYIGKILSISFI